MAGPLVDALEDAIDETASGHGQQREGSRSAGGKTGTMAMDNSLDDAQFKVAGVKIQPLSL